MKLEEVLPALRDGKKIRRNGWLSKRNPTPVFTQDCYIQLPREPKCTVFDGGFADVGFGELLKDDWEVVE